MARFFQREPIDGGDNGVWGDPELIQNRISLGINTFQLYDNAGTLTAPIGKCGLITSSIYGVAYNNAIETISLAAVTNGNWFKVEVQRSGTTFTFVVSDTSTGVDTDPAVIPSGFDSAYDANKGGYYINTDYRTIAVGYKDGSGNLAGIVNTLSSNEGYIGYSDNYKNFFTKRNITNSEERISINDDITIGDGESRKYIFRANSKTATLPTVADNIGVVFEFWNGGIYSSVIDGEGAETFIFQDGDTATEIDFTAKGDYIRIISDGTNWIVLGGRWGYVSGSLTTGDGGGAYTDSAAEYEYWYENGLIHFTAWGWVEVDATSDNVQVDITVPFTMSKIKTLQITPNGYKTSDPSSLLNGLSQLGVIVGNITAIDTTSLRATIGKPAGVFVATIRYAFSINMICIV